MLSPLRDCERDIDHLSIPIHYQSELPHESTHSVALLLIERLGSLACAPLSFCAPMGPTLRLTVSVLTVVPTFPLYFIFQGKYTIGVESLSIV
jgi:hypothetical protein